MTYDELAVVIFEKLGENPHLTLNLLASSIDATVQDVATVIDEYEIVDGKPVHNGPGQGGSWLPERYRADMRTAEAPVQLGYRWPDNSLRDVAFDINDPDHRAEFKDMEIQ